MRLKKAFNRATDLTGWNDLPVRTIRGANLSDVIG